MEKFMSRFLSEEDAALDQWVTVLVLAILAIAIFQVLNPLIKDIFVGITNNLGNRINNLIP